MDYPNNTQSQVSCEHIEGIKCGVKNCMYHDGETFCTAKSIAVGPHFATSSADTVCVTFQAKKQ